MTHVVSIELKWYSLPGVLPPELVKLPYLQKIDFAYNYLSGTIPREWALLPLKSISVLANRLSGEIPKELGDITSLTYLSLEANQFSGIIPSELGNLINLNTLMLSSNQLSGKLPVSFSGLTNLTDFRINDNNFNGTIPDFIRNWKKLTRLEMHASGLEGPIPSAISSLDNLEELRISDIDGPTQDFPLLSSMTGIVRLVLRSCKISGKIPAYIWEMKNLQMLDVSFNKLAGEIPTDISTKTLKFIFLSGNMLSGNVPDSILKEGSSESKLKLVSELFSGELERLMWKNFNIKDEAGGAQKPVIKQLFNVSVTNNILVIRFFWPGKGTTRIPDRGVYGPLISAISVNSNLKPCSNGGKKEVIPHIIIGVGALCLITLILGILWWKGCLQGEKKKEKVYITLSN
ncbi:hypothetical protein L1049_010183 [Liquidambar formosana]|uniref:non-specific serine/threonine protein kinase n=1 Tax=Liquidambar formosana TaxID=63359 RepID=A0AAP0R461_LIQFO